MSSAAEAVRSSEAVRPSEEQPWLIFFHSKLDGRSRRVEAFLAQVLQRRKNHQTFVRYEVDVDERPEVAERFGVDEVPTLVVVGTVGFRRGSPAHVDARKSTQSSVPGCRAPATRTRPLEKQAKRDHRGLRRNLERLKDRRPRRGLRPMHCSSSSLMSSRSAA